MSEAEYEIPSHRLPKGFAENVERVPDAPATPRPAATIVLVRQGNSGPEVLLLKRNRTVGFVPGAYVFPGGRVDAEDASPELAALLYGVSPAEAAKRLGVEESDDGALAYYVAALREAFEETGIMIGSTPNGDPLPPAAADDSVRGVLTALHRGERTFAEAVKELDVTLDGLAVEYIAHWVTPRAEPRRYDTRFFVAVVPDGTEALPDGGEITQAVWLSPEAALARNEAGSLPMIFPTIKTIQSLCGFESVLRLRDSFAGREIPTILPRLVRTPTGVGIQLPEEDGES